MCGGGVCGGAVCGSGVCAGGGGVVVMVGVSPGDAGISNRSSHQQHADILC